jgi:hypothetical protein
MGDYARLRISTIQRTPETASALQLFFFSLLRFIFFFVLLQRKKEMKENSGKVMFIGDYIG